MSKERYPSRSLKHIRKLSFDYYTMLYVLCLLFLFFSETIVEYPLYAYLLFSSNIQGFQFGRGGGGAPITDKNGYVVTSKKQTLTNTHDGGM